VLGFGQNLARTGKLGRRRFEISTFASDGQPFSSSCLAANLPVFPLALAAGALVIAESLSSALNLEEISVLSIGADFNVMRLKKLPPEYAVQ
jgi:hypothetical protein